MEIKKSPAADLENKKMLFTLLGLVVMLSVVYIALEWNKTEVTKYDDVTLLGEADEEEMMPVTVQDQTPPPPPPEAVAPPPVAVTEISIVTNDTETGDLDMKSSESDEDIEIIPQAPIQVEVEEEEIDEIISFAVIEEKPSFPGGDVMKWIGKNMKYPAKAAENGVEGRVTVQFTIGKDGKVTDAKVVRGKDPSLDKEALRVVNSMPAWNPGKQRGKPVRVSYVLPIVFKLKQ